MAVICRSPRTAIAARATIPPRRWGRSPRRAPRQPGPGSSRGRSRRVRHARRARADPANPPATAAATREPSTALAVTHAERVSPAPTTARSVMAHPPPPAATAAPTVVPIALAVTRCSGCTTRGRAAERPTRTNRLTPVTSSAPR